MKFSVPGYDVGDLLGTGSSASVRAGRRRSDGQVVALKCIGYDRADAIRAARAEAALLGALAHPDLIHLYEFVVCRDSLVLVLELAEGGSLADLLRRRGILTPAEVAAALSPVGAALGYAHRQGVVHMDVSAANVLFTREGRPKLADLGVARLGPIPADSRDLSGDVDAAASAIVVADGVADALGTPAYLDSFVAAGGLADSTSDVFSLGAVALHALTGLGPWQKSADDPVDAILAAARCRVLPIPLAERLAGCPESMATVVSRALEENPLARGTAEEFALDLRAAGGVAQVVMRAGRLTARPGRHSPEHRQIAAAAVAAGQPDFVRPHLVENSGFLDAVPLDLTQLRRPHVREPVPVVLAWSRFTWLRRAKSCSADGPRAVVGRVRLGGWPRVPARRVVAGAAAVVGVAVVGVGFAAAVGTRDVGSAGHPGAAGATYSPSASASSVVPATVAVGEPVTTTSASSPVATPSAAASKFVMLDIEHSTALALRALDAGRARAFAHRNVTELASVYHSPVLLADDQRQLRRRVPVGCHVDGLTTVYSGLHVIRHTTSSIEFSVTAAQAGARLKCPGQASEVVGPAKATKMTVTLTADRAGRLGIAALRVGDLDGGPR